MLPEIREIECSDNASPTTEIIVGGDLCPWGRNEQLFVEGSTADIVHDLADLFQESHLKVFNLECPLIGKSTPIEKAGPVLEARQECIEGIKELGVHAVSLANNHSMDHGPEGLQNTLRVCSDHGIAVFGAGENLSDASRVLVTNSGNLKIGLLGIADREFSIASERQPGACPIDEMLIHHLLCGATGWDVLLVLVHAGTHMNPFPSPRMQRLCRYLADLGASAVICQHSHCIGSYEVYRGTLIVYGQGNFVFDWQPSPGPEWHEGVILKLGISGSKVDFFEFIPFSQSTETPGVHLVEPHRRVEILRTLEERRPLVEDPVWVRDNWLSYCKSVEKQYYELLKGKTLRSRFLRRFTDELGLAWNPFSAFHKQLLGNLVRSGDHREVLETILIERE